MNWLNEYETRKNYACEIFIGGENRTFYRRDKEKLDDKHRYMMFDQNVMKEYIPPGVMKLLLLLFQNCQNIPTFQSYQQ